MDSTPQSWYISSTGQGLSLTIQGAMISILPVVILAAQKFNLPLSQDVAMQVIQLTAVAVSIVVTAAGLIRKAYNYFKNRNQNK